MSKFALVGLASTLLYAALAVMFQSRFQGDFGQGTLSFAAFAIAAVFSYTAHRVFTFTSQGAYRLEIPRFAVLTATGAAISYVLPTILEGTLKMPMFVSAAGVCVLIPVINFLALDRWVFSDRKC